MKGRGKCFVYEAKAFPHGVRRRQCTQKAPSLFVHHASQRHGHRGEKTPCPQPSCVHLQCPIRLCCVKSFSNPVAVLQFRFRLRKGELVLRVQKDLNSFTLNIPESGKSSVLKCKREGKNRSVIRMDGVLCQTSPDCVVQSASIDMCIGLTEAETQISCLPAWKRELIRKKRLNNGLGSCNVQSGIVQNRFFSYGSPPTKFHEFA